MNQIIVLYQQIQTKVRKTNHMESNRCTEACIKTKVFTYYYDANLMCNILYGRPLTGVIHFRTKFLWIIMTKKQYISEISTYGSKLLASHTFFEKCIEHKHYVLIIKYHFITSAMFRVTMNLWSTEYLLQIQGYTKDIKDKFVSNIIAAQYINLQHLRSEFNIADILSKKWSY